MHRMTSAEALASFGIKYIFRCKKTWRLGENALKAKRFFTTDAGLGNGDREQCGSLSQETSKSPLCTKMEGSFACRMFKMQPIDCYS